MGIADIDYVEAALRIFANLSRMTPQEAEALKQRLGLPVDIDVTLTGRTVSEAPAQSSKPKR